jgi:hypothetical protein
MRISALNVSSGAEERNEDLNMASETLAASAIQEALDGCVAAGSPGAIIAIDAPRLGIAFSRSLSDIDLTAA